MALLSYIFSLVVLCLSYIVYQKYVNLYTSIVLKPNKRYDYIIVGAGTAGCVLAARLSEDPTIKILLVEAGSHMGYFTRVPLTATAAQQSPNDWAVKTEPQRYSSFGMWGQFLPRGKGLGGSGQINFLLHGVGVPEDYDRWRRLGFQGWTFEALKPYFVKAFGTMLSEFDSGDCSVVGDCPGKEVPMKLKLISDEDDLLSTFRAASASLKDDATLKKATACVKDGVRHMSFDAYLKPALNRKNLHVLINTRAVSIRFVNNTASSLYILQNHRELNNIFANKEIILCAGAIKTPQILMLSGIGPTDVLRKLRVKPVSINDHVGKNLHDYMNMPVYVSVRKPITITLAKVFSFKTVWEYLWKGSVRELFAGYLSFPPVVGVEYQNESAVMVFAMGTASERLLRDLSNYRPQVFRSTFPYHNQTSKEGFMFLSSCLQPRSRGTVVAVENSVRVDPNYLHSYDDVRCIVRAIRRAEALVSTESFKAIGARIHWPRPERCRTFWNYTEDDQRGSKRRRISRKESNPPRIFIDNPPDAYLECIIREVAVTGHHVGGTAAGGRVVDRSLTVKSVSNLRVIDASVFPTPISLFPNSVLIAMAEKAAHIIKSTS